MGNYMVTAARAVGVSIDSLQRWRRLGEEGREPFACAELTATKHFEMFVGKS
jgi:hypothetical protein